MDSSQLLKRLRTIEEDISRLRRELEKDTVPEEEQIIGLFDGEFMVTEEGKKYQVPPNYASKTMLVPGDTLRLIEEGPRNTFKHVGKVERLETEGVLVQRGEEWFALCEEGEFRILPASIKHFEADVGDRIKLFIPKNFSEIDAKWGAMSGLVKEVPGGAKREVSKLVGEKEKKKLPVAEMVPPGEEERVREEKEEQFELR